MRKEKREIKDFAEIIDLINNIDTIHLGIHHELYPYVVPVSFGYCIENGNLVFYFHGAKAGKKYKLLQMNPYVCLEGDNCYRFKDTISSVTCLYESFIAYGKCELIDDRQESLKALQLLLDHCGYRQHSIHEEALEMTAIFKVTVDSITGKRRF